MHSYFAGTFEASAQSGEGGEKCWVIVALNSIERLDGGKGSLPLSIEINDLTKISNIEGVTLILHMNTQGGSKEGERMS